MSFDLGVSWWGQHCAVCVKPPASELWFKFWLLHLGSSFQLLLLACCDRMARRLASRHRGGRQSSPGSLFQPGQALAFPATWGSEPADEMEPLSMWLNHSTFWIVTSVLFSSFRCCATFPEASPFPPSECLWASSVGVREYHRFVWNSE